MYKLLLCWRYLRTRYLALVCIVSVMLGVATLIVVNAVMGGFSTKLQERLHGLLSDVILEGHDQNGFTEPDARMAMIRQDPWLGERIKAMSAVMEVFGVLQFTVNGNPQVHPVRMIGVEPKGRAGVGGFAEHVYYNKDEPTFSLTAKARDAKRDAPFRGNGGLQLVMPMKPFGGEDEQQHDGNAPPKGLVPPPAPPPDEEFKPEGCIVGYALANRRYIMPDGKSEEKCILEPGDDVVLTTISGAKLQPVHARFTVSDFFRSEMSEYDSNYVFVPLHYLQKIRTAEDRVTSIQIRLNDPRDEAEVVDRLKRLFGGSLKVMTWKHKQGALLAAISIEKGILNVLLFMIIGVAGFGILAIFSMIVVEKTRDIGIMKSLGGSNWGVLQIFVGYGLLLGLVGSLAGTGLGIWITTYINQIESWISYLTGQEIFPRDVYYFDRIPTDLRAMQVFLINLGAVGIAVMFSVLPALRASMLHPVRALRFE